MLISLQGKNDIYSFDPENQADVIYTRGKFSSLYRGRRKSDNAVVTIKHLRDSSCINGEQHAELLMQILLGMNDLHSGIAKTYDLISTEAGYFIMREYLQGVDLKAIAYEPDHRNLSTPIFTCKLGIQLCEILSTLHKNGIIHRDIKPSNIFIETDEYGRIDEHNFKVRLIDFELAQVSGASLFVNKKSPFAMIYSPPEQVLRHANLIDATSDLYSLAISLYEFITRRPAFYHKNPEMLINMQLNHTLVKHPRISKDMYSLLLKATSKHKFPLPPNRYKPENLIFFLTKGKEDRFQSGEEFIRSLEFLLDKLEAKQALKDKGNFFTKLFKKR